MNSIDVLSLTGSIASVILAVVAIVLSIVFYAMSNRLSDSTKKAADGIGASVERLEKLFDRLYSDTFSMMRDTVSDMRKHMWPEEARSQDKIDEETEKIADEKIENLRNEIGSQISKVIKQQQNADAKITEVKGLFDKAITESRKADMEAREESIRQHIITLLHKLKEAPAGKIGEIMRARYDYQLGEVFKELFRMKEDHLVAWDNEEYLEYGSIVHLL